jgi:hypothetical protein
MDSNEPLLGPASKWRLKFSMLVTAAWLLLGLTYITHVVGWSEFATQNAPSLGSFLEGAFAPLAFLWLVVGFFLQQQQLSENTATIQLQLVQMRRATEQAAIQARAIAADELHSHQDTFMRTTGLVNQQLGMIAGWIISSWEGDLTAETTELWLRTGKGEAYAFSMRILRSCLPGNLDPEELFYGTEIRSNHTRRFITAFERLTEAGSTCDPTGMIVEALRDGPHGRVYRMIVEHAPRSS